jgi:hypothetical protein
MPRFVIAVIASAGLLACNAGQPRIYKVAVDLSPATPVRDATCYFNQAVPVNVVDTTNLRSDQQWVIWDAVNSTGQAVQYLDCGEQQAHLGNSPVIDFTSAIETTTSGTFVGTERQSETFGNNQFTQVRNATITVNFADEGATPTGTMTLHSEYACTPMNNCPMETATSDFHSCSVSLNFTARRIDTSRISAYNDQGKGP